MMHHLQRAWLRHQKRKKQVFGVNMLTDSKLGAGTSTSMVLCQSENAIRACAQDIQEYQMNGKVGETRAVFFSTMLLMELYVESKDNC